MRNSLNFYDRIAAQNQGYDITGYAPNTQTANVLHQDTDISANTVIHLLHIQDLDLSEFHRSSGKFSIWIVGEARLLSAKDVHVLLQEAEVHQIDREIGEI